MEIKMKGKAIICIAMIVAVLASAVGAVSAADESVVEFKDQGYAIKITFPDGEGIAHTGSKEIVLRDRCNAEDVNLINVYGRDAYEPVNISIEIEGDSNIRWSIFRWKNSVNYPFYMPVYADTRTKEFRVQRADHKHEHLTRSRVYKIIVRELDKEYQPQLDIYFTLVLNGKTIPEIKPTNKPPVANASLRCVNVSGNVLEEVLFAPIRNVEVRLTSIEGPTGVYSTNENTTLARITPEGDYYIRVPPGVYSICAMAFGYIPSRGLGGERMELPAVDLTGQLTTEHQNLRLLRLPCTVFGNVTDNITELPINKAHVSLDGPPHIYPPHPNVRIKTETNASGKYRFILTFGVHPGGLYNISVSKSGYLTKTQNFTLNWSNVITDYYKCPLSPLDYNPPIVNFSLLSGPSELPDLTLVLDGIQIIFNENIATISATIHNIGTVDASNIVVQFFDGDPDAGGTQIGTDRKISGIAHDSSGTVQVTWTAIPGTHDIFVRVDPYDTVLESREDNNQAYKQITIGGAKTIYVDDDFTDNPANHRWDRIQEGINDADDGDTVLVYNGTYTETVDLNKRLTLVGEEMPKIEAHGSGDAIHVTADNCTVKGFCCVNAQPSPYAGIHVESCNNFIVENTCKDNYKGIYLSGSSNEIWNNIANYNNKSGITLSGSDNNRIIGNDASNNVNYGGIYLYLSNNNEIQNNIANYNHDDGICLLTSNENRMANNTAKDNGRDGIHLFKSSNNNIRNNIANYNHDDGIGLSRSSENIIVNNTAKDNVDDGIVLFDSSNNNIYLNNFVDNANNAYSYNSSNIWHSTSEISYTYNSQSHTNFLGNYWSDYKGSDTDGDGIGGSAYSIDGDEDICPLMKPWESYFALQVNWPPHNPTLIPDKPEPQPAGTAITWSASATEPDGDTLYYRFWIKGPSTGDLWTIIQDWSTDNTLSWHTTTADIGDTDIAVWIRDGHHEPTNSHDLEMVISNYQIVSGTCKVQITSDPSDTDRPSLVYANGFYYVAYQSIEKSHGIYIKKFDALWKFKKKEEVVSGSAYYDSPSLAFANNKLYVVYISNAEGANKNDYDVIVKEYNPNSFACTSGEKYLTTLQSCQDLPALYYNDGYFYLAYQSWETGNGDIYIKKFDSNWNPLKQVRVTSKSSLQDGPSITYADGYFYVAYYSMETDNRDIFVKRLNTNLNLDVFKKQITFETSRQTYPSIAFVNNQFAIAYASTETGTWGIYMKKYDKNWNFIEKMKVVDDNSAHERRPSITYAQNDLWIAYVRYLEESDNWYTFAIIPGCE
ncbi:Cell surface glycoprotein [ANME-1 cluster archaeon GoMg3.2]|nr:Cell surface glycoprotein [ANME-1 cluster archaeon GoMg3.2]